MKSASGMIRRPASAACDTNGVPGAAGCGVRKSQSPFHGQVSGGELKWRRAREPAPLFHRSARAKRSSSETLLESAGRAAEAGEEARQRLEDSRPTRARSTRNRHAIPGLACALPALPIRAAMAAWSSMACQDWAHMGSFRRQHKIAANSLRMSITDAPVAS